MSVTVAAVIYLISRRNPVTADNVNADVPTAVQAVEPAAIG